MFTMRRFLYAAVLAATAMLVLPRGADAQLLRFGVGAGPATPVGDFADVAGTGAHAQAMLALRVPLLPISARGDLIFTRLPSTSDGDIDQVAGVVNGFLSILPLPVVSAYLTGGVGMYRTSGGGESTTEFGVNGGVGARINLWVVEPFAEVRYHHVTGTGGPRVVPVTIGVMF